MIPPPVRLYSQLVEFPDSESEERARTLISKETGIHSTFIHKDCSKVGYLVSVEQYHLILFDEHAIPYHCVTDDELRKRSPRAYEFLQETRHRYQKEDGERPAVRTGCSLLEFCVTESSAATAQSVLHEFNPLEIRAKEFDCTPMNESGQTGAPRNYVQFDCVLKRDAIPAAMSQLYASGIVRKGCCSPMYILDAVDTHWQLRGK